MPDAPPLAPAPTYERFFTTRDGLDLLARGWQPAQPRAHIALVHGYAEHSGRYAALAAYLVRHGYAVHTYDQRGHGRSAGRRAYVHTFDEYLTDLATVLTALSPSLQGPPLFLFGHSMGGAVAALYCLEHKPLLQGLLLSSAALQLPDHIAPLLQKLSAVVGLLLPRLPTVRLDRTLLSRDPGVVAQAEQDPLNYHGKMPARTGAELIRATKRIRGQIDGLAVPLLLIHGTADAITDPDGSIACYHQAGSRDKTLSLYPGLFHETFNEPEKEQVVEEIVAWLDEHVEASPSRRNGGG